MVFGNLTCNVYNLENGYSAKITYNSKSCEDIYITSRRLSSLYRKAAKNIYISFGDVAYKLFLDFYTNVDSNMVRYIVMSNRTKKRLLKKEISYVRNQLNLNPEYSQKLKLLSKLNNLNIRINELR